MRLLTKAREMSGSIPDMPVFVSTSGSTIGGFVFWSAFSPGASLQFSSFLQISTGRLRRHITIST